jgi:triosephosphate isomerase
VRQLVAGNWKMNGLASSLDELAVLKTKLSPSLGGAPCDVLVCPPATLIAQAVVAAGGAFAIGGQDCSSHASGAFTGDISAAMLKDADASAVILGHSERRQYHGETDALVLAKALAAWEAGLSTIICVGESEAQHQEGQSHHICHRQVAGSVPRNATGANTAIAYEPIWAIGTGKTPTAAEIAAMHAHLRRCLIESLGARGTDIRILYGGSVKPSNAAEILNLPEINGVLVGGASLKANDFLGIIAGVKPL